MLLDFVTEFIYQFFVFFFVIQVTYLKMIAKPGLLLEPVHLLPLATIGFPWAVSGA